MTTRLVSVFVGVALVSGTAVFALRSEPADGTVVRDPVTYAGPAGPDSLVGVYEGRTPCGERFVEFAGGRGGGCERIKWRLSLYRTTANGTPTRYEIVNVVVGGAENRVRREGRWTVERGTAADSGAVVYRFATDLPVESIALQRADDNILLFLDGQKRLIVGDAALSYTLSRTR